MPSSVRRMSVTRTEGARLPAYATARRLPSRATENAATSAPVTPGTSEAAHLVAADDEHPRPVGGAVDQPQVAEHVVRRAQDVRAADDRARHRVDGVAAPAGATNTVVPLPETAAIRCGDSLTAKLRIE